MKRITIIGGYYGSGKSEIVAHLALQHNINYVVDLDIINPYFRTRALHDEFVKNDIKIVESTIKNASGSDLPFISGEGRIPFVRKDVTAIYDLGGTELGGKVLIQFKDFIDDVSDIDFLCVVNIYREETSDVKGIINMVQKLEGASQLKVTGIINNTNLINETTLEDIKKGEEVILNACKELGLDIKYTVTLKPKNFDYQFRGTQINLERLVAKKWHLGG